jgi:hypothetical protein
MEHLTPVENRTIASTSHSRPATCSGRPEGPGGGYPTAPPLLLAAVRDRDVTLAVLAVDW